MVQNQKLLRHARRIAGATEAEAWMLDTDTHFSILSTSAIDLTCLPRWAGERKIYDAWDALKTANG